MICYILLLFACSSKYKDYEGMELCLTGTLAYFQNPEQRLEDSKYPKMICRMNE